MPGSNKISLRQLTLQAFNESRITMTYQSVNPYNGEVCKTFAELGGEQLEIAIASAAACYAVWRETQFAARRTLVSRAAILMRERTEELAGLATLEMGKRFAEACGEVRLSADIIEYYAQHAEQFLAPQSLKTVSGEAVIESQPLGVLFGIQPWNFPYYQLARFAAPNIMAGNVVMVKHAGCVPQCAIAFEKLWLDAGAASGLYTNLLISYKQVDQMIDDPRIRGIALTGGVEAASKVAARAGLNLKKTTMELGGNDAFIVLADAAIEQTIQWAVWAKMNNTGQCCVAAKRSLLSRSWPITLSRNFNSPCRR
jgi:succinate-semialdehyde dehydrogenase/glutarate-semialdehyde dehydrogenase